MDWATDVAIGTRKRKEVSFHFDLISSSAKFTIHSGLPTIF